MDISDMSLMLIVDSTWNVAYRRGYDDGFQQRASTRVVTIDDLKVIEQSLLIKTQSAGNPAWAKDFTASIFAYIVESIEKPITVAAVDPVGEQVTG